MSTDAELQVQFEAWLERALTPAPPAEIVAFAINLYDGPSCQAEIVGAEAFDPDDDDWATEEDWVGTRERFVFPDSLADSWEAYQGLATRLLRECLERPSSTARLLNAAEAVAVGFVDGHLELIRGG